MGKHDGPLTIWSQYLGARLASAALTSFNLSANLRTAAALGRGLYEVDQRHRERAQRHVRLAFPEWNAQQVSDTARASFEHFVKLAVEVCSTPRVLTHDTWARHATIEQLGPAIRLLNAGRPVILLTGHTGNWEVLGYLLAVLGYDLDAVARPIDNPLINDWLLGIRQRQGMRIITKFNATDRMVGVLNRGGALGFIADQNAGDKGLFVPFFNRLASTYKSIGLLAMQQQAPIVCGYAHRIGPGFRFEVGTTDIIHPEHWQNQYDPLYYITARYARAIETMVRKRPDQYLWMHRRWKSRPRFERQGKPIPKALRRNLEALPWMDQPTLDDLIAASATPIQRDGGG
jgi:KDO2-lipid IV(A) lauroyltransferase